MRPRFAAGAMAAIACLATSFALAQCGPGGCPSGNYGRPSRQPSWQPGRIHVDVHARVNGPRPIQATRHHAAVVRIGCTASAGQKVYGSGVIVRWRNRLVILTARHVVHDARQIAFRLHNGKAYRAVVVKVDAAWDCAVIAPVDPPSNLPVAEIEFGNAALPKEGEKLESVGFGSDGQLAANVGGFVGFRKSSANPNSETDDWFELQGAARGGDSGGPVFNEKGHVVGILWGTNNEIVVAVQAGRIHALLNEAIPRPVTQQADRRPTMPFPDDGTINVDVDVQIRKHLLKYRNEVDGKLDGIRRQLEGMNRQPMPPMPGEQPTQPMPAPVAPEPPKDDGPKTIPGKIADREAEWLAQHGGPLSKRIAANAEENLDSDSAAVRFKGFTQSKVAMLVFFGGVLLVLGLGVMVLHKINNKVIPILKEKAAQTPNTLDDKLVGVLEKLHGKVDAVEEKIKSHIPNMAETKAKAEAALRVATAAALATPAGPAASVAAGVAAAVIPTATPPQ